MTAVVGNGMGFTRLVHSLVGAVAVVMTVRDFPDRLLGGGRELHGLAVDQSRQRKLEQHDHGDADAELAHAPIMARRAGV